MSEVAEEVMDSSAVSEEEVEDQQETSQKETSLDKSSSWGEIIEGKRAKKSVERLDIQAPKQMEKLKIGDGSGDKLGDIPRTSYQIGRMKPTDLRPLHTILFDRPGKMSTIKKNLRQFNGFAFDMDSEQYTKKRDKLLKNSHFTKIKLKGVCGVLDLEKKGTHSDLVDRILTFLISPKNSGKRLPTKKKKKSKKKLSGDDSKTKTKKKSKPKPSSSSSPKKSKAGSKSKAIVMDSSSDEDEDEDDEKARASAEAEGSDTEEKPSEKEEDQSDKSEQSEEEEDEDDDDEDDDDESPKPTSGRGKAASKKSAPVKRQRTPAKKKTAPPKKRPRKDASELDSASDSDEMPKKKKAVAAKPAAKTKKADSSSNSKNNTNTADDSSDDDEPLIKMIKKAPTDEQLKETVQSLLKEANLEEMTMKQICQKVFDTYSDHDLTSKKDFIKQTVKSLIT